MAHYAKVVDGVVVDVINAEPDFFDTFVDDSAGEWIQTSYNSYGGVHYDPETNQPSGKEALRMNFASVGYTYDKERDAFIGPQPYPSWVLNQETLIWESPVPFPPVLKYHWWDEENLQWVLHSEVTQEELEAAELYQQIKPE